MSDAISKARERTEGEGLVGVFVDRQEFTAMLDVIEAAEQADMFCNCIGSGGINQLPKLTYECASHRFGKALTRFRDLFGNDE